MGVVGHGVVAVRVPVGSVAAHLRGGEALVAEGGALAEGEAQVLWLPRRQGVADTAALGDVGVDGVEAGEDGV